MPIRAVIFDIGEVLTYTVDRSRHKKWEVYLGLQGDRLFDIVDKTGMANAARLGQVSVEEIWQRVQTFYGLDDEQMQGLEQDFWSGGAFNHQLANFLSSLRPRYKTALLSNAWQGARERVSQDFHLNEIVDLMLFSAEEGLAKPDPRFYQLALSRLSVRPEEAVFLDDKSENVDAARALGIWGIRYETNEQAIAEIEACFILRKV